MIYVVVKGAHQVDGAFTFFTCEKAFSKEEDVKKYVEKLPTIWTEKVNDVVCHCERAVHLVELYE